MADDFLLEFIDESQTHLAACESILLGLKSGTVPEVEEVNAAFRALHTIKGGAGFLEQDRIQRLSHAGEQLLDLLRSGTLVVTSDHIDLLLRTVTDLRGLLEVAQGQGAGEAVEPTQQIARLKAAVSLVTSGHQPPSTPPAAKRSLDGWVGELTALDATDGPGLRACLEGLAHEAPATPAVQAVLQALRQTAAQVEAGDRPAFDRLLALAGDLLAAVMLESTPAAPTPEVSVPTTPAPAALRPAAAPPVATPAPVVPARTTAAPAPASGSGTRSVAGLVGELVTIDPGDQESLVRTVEALMAAAENHPASSTSLAILTQIRLLGGLFRTTCSSPAQPSRFRRLLELAGALVHHLPAEPSPPPMASPPAPDGGGGSPASTASAQGPSPLLDFMAESIDLLADAERICLAGGLPDKDGLDAVFRCFHTIKGMASYLAQPAIEAEAHGVETRLLPLRDGERSITDADRNDILAAIDGLRTRIACLTDEPQPARLGDILVATGVPRSVVEETASHLKPGQRLGEALVATGAATPAQVERAVAVQQVQSTAQAPAIPAAAGRPGADGFSRVATSKLEDLMNLVGELLISQSLIVHDTDLVVGSRLQQEATRQSRIIRDLQVLALSLRMVPLRGTFQKLARAVHDTARKCGKELEFQVTGEDTEVDRTLAEAIADPLLHMVRNGVDHGIEAPEARASRGKARQGSLRLSACHAGDNVVITLADDGNGMDPARLKAKAIEKGLISADAHLTDAQAYDLIFLPGFSTAAAVTNVSGRGVGMDVVRKAVEAAKGSVSIDSTLGKGSVFTIRLPLTTAILDAMLLRSGDRSFLVPVQSIVEAVRPAPGQTQTLLGRDRVLQSRGRSMPIVHLGTLFGIDGAEAAPEASIMLVLEDGAKGLALQVDEILGQQQVVIKPLSGSIPHHPGVTGTAILGDGRVGLILDPTRLAGA